MRVVPMHLGQLWRGFFGVVRIYACFDRQSVLSLRGSGSDGGIFDSHCAEMLDT